MGKDICKLKLLEEVSFDLKLDTEGKDLNVSEEN